MAGLADLRMGCQEASRLHVTTNLLRELETGWTLLVQTSRMDAISGWEALNHLCMEHPVYQTIQSSVHLKMSLL